MKKIISLILAISCILCLASCSRGSEGKGDGLEVSIGSARIEKNILDEVVIIIRTHVNNTSDEEKDMIWLKDSATQAGKGLDIDAMSNENTYEKLPAGESFTVEYAYVHNEKDAKVKFTIISQEYGLNLEKEFDPELLLL